MRMTIDSMEHWWNDKWDGEKAKCVEINLSQCHFSTANFTWTHLRLMMACTVRSWPGYHTNMLICTAVNNNSFGWER
jgi:hypothetical protein